MRRLLRHLLRLLLLIVILIEGLWLARAQILAPLLRGPVAGLLGDALDAEVELGGIGGEWPYSIELQGLQVRSTGGAIRQLDAGWVSVRVDPWRLLRGDLGGLRELHLRARELALAPPAATAEPAAAPAAPPSLQELLELLPDGASVAIDRFTWTTAHGTRAGELRIDLDPHAADACGLLARAGGVEVQTRLAADGRAKVTAAVADVVALAGLCGLELDAKGGWLHARGSVVFDPHTWRPRAAAAQVTLRAITAAQATIDESRLHAAWDGHGLEVDELHLQLPGLRVIGNGLELPALAGSAPELAHRLRGMLEVQLLDAAPYVQLLPAELAPLLPIRGQLGLRLQGERLELLAADLETARGRLEADGQLEFGAGLWPPVSASVALRATVSPGPVWPGLDALQVHGQILARGMLFPGDPRGSLHLVLPRGGYGELRWEHAELGIALQDGRADATLAVLQVMTADLGDVAAGALTAHGSIAMRGFDPDMTAVELRIDGRGLRAGAEQFTLAARARAGAERIELTELQLRHHEGTLSAHAALATSLCEFDPAAALAGAVTVDQFRLAVVPSPKPLAGTASARLELSGTLHRPGLALHATTSLDAPLRTLLGLSPPEPEPPLRIALAAATGAGGIRIDDLQASIADQRLDLQLAGTLPLALDVEQGLHALAAGELNGSMTCTWSEDPVGRVELTAGLFASEQGIGIRDGRLTQQFGGARIDLTLDRTLAALCAGASPVGAGVTGSIELAELELSALPFVRLSQSQLSGRAAGSVRIGGKLDPAQPLALLQHAEFELRDGGLKLGLMPRLEQIRCRLSADPARVRITEFAATAGARPLELSGELVAGQGTLLSNAGAATADLRIRVDDALLWRSRGVKIRAGVDATLKGPLDAMQLSGTASLASGKLVKRIVLLPDLQGRGGESVATGFELPALPPELGKRIALDLSLKTEQPMILRTSVVDTDLRADLRLTGTAARPRLVGSVYGEGGVLRFPGGRLALDELLVTFRAAAPENPDLVLAATGRRAGYTIDLRIGGSQRSPEITVSSSPPLPTEDLLVLLSTGTIPSRLREQSPRQHALLASSILAQQLLEDLLGSESTERGESFIDQVTFEAGREISRNGVESLLVEVRLDDTFALEGERDVYEDYNAGLVVRFRFR